MQAFTDLVGTTVVPAHCFDTTELTDLTPALDTATAVHDMAAHASEAVLSYGPCPPRIDSDELTDLVPSLDLATAIHDMAEQASEASVSGGFPSSSCGPRYGCD